MIEGNQKDDPWHPKVSHWFIYILIKLECTAAVLNSRKL